MAELKNNPDLETQFVHATSSGEPPAGKPTATPVYAAATYTYESMDQMDQAFAGEIDGYVYTRHGNPTVTIFEQAMCAVEGGATARAYGSGMAAIHAALFACELSPGSVVLASQDLYGATTNLLLNIFGSFGIKTVFADFSNLEEVSAKTVQSKPRVLIAETISNPLLKICDVDA